jgi:hypothetical protein
MRTMNRDSYHDPSTSQHDDTLLYHIVLFFTTTEAPSPREPVPEPVGRPRLKGYINE